VSLPYATEPFLWHAGSNTMNLALIAVQPTRDFAMVMATNIGGRKAEEALTALAGEIYGRFGPAPVR
jgi:hypothetical protein